ncbi:MAG: radical SAM protein [Gemmatimonadaceae bacterium]|nr:radical SAM protein [Gemmatimonadaceae bacterium]
MRQAQQDAQSAQAYSQGTDALQPTLPLAELASPPRHPVVGSQKDIRYYGTIATGVLNSPESTGMPFWSINPYIGCAFGCTYCYARYAHRFVMERATRGTGDDRRDADEELPLVLGAGSEGTRFLASGESLPADADRVPVPDSSSETSGEELEELPPWLAFERRIFVKRNAAQVLRRTLQGSRKSLGAVRHAEPIVIGTATDPYQPAERHFRVTRQLLETLAELKRLRLVIITKSPLITRDIDLLSRIARRSRLTIHLSLITLDRDLARRIEPRAPTPESRLRALRRLHDAGIDVGINIMPVLPGITDRPDALEALVRQVAAHGASHINACALRLRVTSRRRYLPWLDEEFPDLAPRYRKAYGNHFQIADRYRDGLRQFLKRACRKAGIRYGSPEERAFEGAAAPRAPGEPSAAATPTAATSPASTEAWDAGRYTPSGPARAGSVWDNAPIPVSRISSRSPLPVMERGPAYVAPPAPQFDLGL